MKSMERCFIGFLLFEFFFSFQHHIYKKILNTFFTDLDAICFLIEFDVILTKFESNC